MNAANQESTLPLYNRVDSQHVGTKVAERIVPSQLYKRIAPRFSDIVTYKHSDINKAIYDKCLKEMHVWFLAQILSSLGKSNKFQYLVDLYQQHDQVKQGSPQYIFFLS